MPEPVCLLAGPHGQRVSDSGATLAHGLPKFSAMGVTAISVGRVEVRRARPAIFTFIWSTSLLAIGADSKSAGSLQRVMRKTGLGQPQCALREPLSAKASAPGKEMVMAPLAHCWLVVLLKERACKMHRTGSGIAAGLSTFLPFLPRCSRLLSWHTLPQIFKTLRRS